MRRKLTITAVLATLFAIGPAAFLSACGGYEDSSGRIVLQARAPERGNWYPREIRVERGQPVTILVRNTDIATHSFYLPSLGLDTGPLKPGESREVTFTPQNAGEYLFLCAVWCSDYHMYETGYLIVE